MICFPIPHYILAGGHSRRFGSDKARHEIAGVPMLTRVAKAIQPLASKTIVIARKPHAYADLGLNTISDAVPEVGPLGGVYTALRHASETSTSLIAGTEWVFITSCDWHHPHQRVIRELNTQISASTLVIAYKGQRWIEPFPGLYHLDVKNPARELIDRGLLSMQGLFESLGDALSTLPLGHDRPLDLDTSDLSRNVEP